MSKNNTSSTTFDGASLPRAAPEVAELDPAVSEFGAFLDLISPLSGQQRKKACAEFRRIIDVLQRQPPDPTAD